MSKVTHVASGAAHPFPATRSASSYTNPLTSPSFIMVVWPAKP